MGWKGILGFDYGVVQAPLGPDISGPELAAAVANAGGIGLLRLPDWPAPDHVRELIRKTRSLTVKPFGAAIVLAFPHEENLRVVLEEKLAVLQVYWGEFPRERVDEAHRAGVKVLHQVGSLEEAVKAKEAGVDGIIVQGREAGGHVIGQEGLLPLLPRVVDLVTDSGISVIAAGGIVDGRGYAAALALGALGVCLGTRFLATEESFAHPLYKKRLIEMNCTDYTNVFGRARWPGAPQRVLKTTFYDQWKNLPDHETEEDQPIIGHTIIHGVHRDIRLFAGTVPNATTTGDIDSMGMYAGQGVGLITEIIPASEVVKSSWTILTSLPIPLGFWLRSSIGGKAEKRTVVLQFLLTWIFVHALVGICVRLMALEVNVHMTSVLNTHREGVSHASLETDPTMMIPMWKWILCCIAEGYCANNALSTAWSKTTV